MLVEREGGPPGGFCSEGGMSACSPAARSSTPLHPVNLRAPKEAVPCATNSPLSSPPYTHRTPSICVGNEHVRGTPHHSSDGGEEKTPSQCLPPPHHLLSRAKNELFRRLPKMEAGMGMGRRKEAQGRQRGRGGKKHNHTIQLRGKTTTKKRGWVGEKRGLSIVILGLAPDDVIMAGNKF